METQPTAENLAAVLEAEGLHELAERARRNEFHDFLSPHAFPEVMLVNELTMRGHESLARRVQAGEFDSSKEESDAWADSPEGRALFRELMPGKGGKGSAFFPEPQ